MLEQLGRQQREMADRLEKLAGAADRTSSELRKLTVERRAVQFERRGHMAIAHRRLRTHATAMSSKTCELRHASAASLLLHASRFPPPAPRSTERVVDRLTLPRTLLYERF